MISNSDEPNDAFWDEDDESDMVETCPHCGVEYDEIDYEYQRCHWCKNNA